MSLSESLPNVYGDTGYDFQSTFATGPFNSSFHSKTVARFAGVNSTGAQGFDLSVGNPVYQNNAHVRPFSRECTWLIKFC